MGQGSNLDLLKFLIIFIFGTFGNYFFKKSENFEKNLIDAKYVQGIQ